MGKNFFGGFVRGKKEREGKKEGEIVVVGGWRKIAKRI